MFRNIISWIVPAIIAILCVLWGFFNLYRQKKLETEKENLKHRVNEMKENLAQRDTLFREVLRALPGAFYELCFSKEEAAGFLSGKEKYPQWRKAFHFDRQEKPAEWWLERVHPEDREFLIRSWLTASSQKSEGKTLCYRLLDGRGIYRQILTCFSYSETNHAGMVRLKGLDLDITSIYQHRAGEGIERLLADALLEHQDILAAAIDRQGNICYANGLVQKHLGLSEEKLLGRSWEKTIMEVGEQTNCIENQAENFPSVASTPRNVRWLQKEALSEKGERTHLFLGIDATEIEKAKEEIKHLAYYDALTGLPNREKMFGDLRQYLQGENKKLAMLFIDLDEFKDINDVFGHDTGDEVLKTFTQILGLALADYPVYRLGGDEFVCLVDSASLQDEVKRLSRRIANLLQSPVSLHNKKYYLSCSIGAALYPKDAENEKELYKAADIAMYHAKEKGKNQLCFYDPELTNQALYRIAISSDIHKALLKGEYHMVYQPICTKEDLYGFEALIRWEHPVFGNIAPLSFIPLAEKNGTIGELGYWILDQVFTDIKNFCEKVSGQYVFFINISVKQLKDTKFVSKLKRKLFEREINAESVIFEITESTLIDDFEGYRETLKQIRDLGIRIALDDFGTGYSSLSYLTKLPVDIVKLDKSFIDNVALKSDKRLIYNLIQLIQDYGMQTLGEGVENRNQFEELKKLHCFYFQGYYLSKPKLPEDLWQDMGLVN
ncbi:EAL domain-containing protein [Clostridia bacterium]|nr:EAL domain-containing protein [Clostridia bacterium]